LGSFIIYQNTTVNEVSGINVYKPLDFNRDNAIDVADAEFFKTQLNLTAIPLMADAGYLDYLKADLDGSAEVNTGKTGLVGDCVVAKDVQIFYQFVLPGDTNFDGKVNLIDFANFANSYDPGAAVNTWAQGDFDFDGNTAQDDLLLMASNWLDTLPLP